MLIQGHVLTSSGPASLDRSSSLHQVADTLPSLKKPLWSSRPLSRNKLLPQDRGCRPVGSEEAGAAAGGSGPWVGNICEEERKNKSTLNSQGA